MGLKHISTVLGKYKSSLIRNLISREKQSPAKPAKGFRGVFHLGQIQKNGGTFWFEPGFLV
jgi:hypothetical protein